MSRASPEQFLRIVGEPGRGEDVERRRNRLLGVDGEQARGSLRRRPGFIALDRRIEVGIRLLIRLGGFGRRRLGMDRLGRLDVLGSRVGIETVRRGAARRHPPRAKRRRAS